MLSLLLPVFAADPELRLAYNRGVATVQVVAPPGEHVGDAPATLRIQNGERPFHLETAGNPAGLSLPILPGGIQVEAQISFCNDGATACRLVDFQGSGNISGKKGSFLVPVARPPAPVAASSTGAVKLLDFAAVWCPPCNLMAAQMLEDPSEKDLAPFAVERVDVDQPSSWALKSRYHVGGYPTLIAVDAQGNEVARQVGYPGEEPMRAWLRSLPGLTPLSVLEAGQDLRGKEAAAAARRLAEAERPEAAQKYFANAEDGVDLRIAKLLVSPNKEDARWLLQQGAPAGDWVYTAVEEAPEERSAILGYLLRATPGDAAGYLETLAEGKAEADLLKAAAIRLIQEELTGDDEKDRGYFTDLASLYADIGQWEEAEKLLARAISRWPQEFTWHFVLARIRLEANLFEGAEAEARLAYQNGYGDQRLRAAMVLAKALKGLKRGPEAVAVLEGALAEIPEPPAGVEVRTHRYRQQVTELKAEVGK